MVFDSGEQRVEWQGSVAAVGGRRLRLAFAVSIGLHILVALQTGQLPAAPAMAPNLLATLRPAEGVQAVAQAAPGALPPPTFTPIPAHRAVATVAAAAPAPTFPAPAVALPASPATVPANMNEAVPAGAVAPPAAQLPPPDAAEGLSADGLRRYRLGLAAQARRFKRYPAQALASNWTGMVEIRLDIGGDGQPTAVLVLHSSGYAVLDRAALTMIEEGARHAPLPVELRGKVFSVVLPVVFDLTER